VSNIASPSGTVLLLSGDLATSSKVAGAAAREGVRLEVALDVASLAEKAAAAQPVLAIIDLTLPRIDLGSIVGQLRGLPAAPRAIIAFGPHVHEALLEAAREAGCDQVISRGQFHARLDEILRTAVTAAQE
jgi:AmiR/NasT family two-component response regulator